MTFTVMRTPLYTRPGHAPTRADAVPFIECQTREEAREVLRVLNEFSRHPPGPMMPDPIHHFIEGDS